MMENCREVSGETLECYYTDSYGTRYLRIINVRVCGQSYAQAIVFGRELSWL